jgi:hypoxanthine-DNA glycosylase
MVHYHPFLPVFGENSRVLILGTFPSPKSRALGFYYGHPQNRFWKLLAEITGVEIAKTIEAKRKLILTNNLALYDVLGSCESTGASDSGITNVVPSDLSIILNYAPIEIVFSNGSRAYEFYQKYQLPQTKIPAVKLPSTSPANASYSLVKLVELWRCALETAAVSNDVK